MTGRERRLLRMLCMTAGSGGGGGGGDKPWEEMTWDEVIAATKNGKYKKFEVGAMKELDLGTEGIVHMQIVGIDVDDLADGSGKAPLTFISKELLNTSHRMNPTSKNGGGWEASEMRAYLRGTVKPLIPSNVSTEIKNVTKYSFRIDTGTNAATTDDVWIPSWREANFGNGRETDGPSYADIFSDNASRVKMAGTNNASIWWTRSTNNVTTSSFSGVSTSGSSYNYAASKSYGVALGFCL